MAVERDEPLKHVSKERLPDEIVDRISLYNEGKESAETVSIWARKIRQKFTFYSSDILLDVALAALSSLAVDERRPDLLRMRKIQLNEIRDALRGERDYLLPLGRFRINGT